jgi:beta-glucanase (GH16 family)
VTIDPNNLAATARLTFSDEFNGLSIWNGATGTWSTNWWYNDEWGLYPKSNGGTLEGNGELQWYINDNYAATSAVNPWSVNNGVLSITADKASSTISPLINNYKYTSGELNTWHSFSQTYGYFEISAKLPAGQGLWPAFWLLQEDGDWPPEIDVMEVLGQDTTKLYSTVHTEQTGSHTASYFNAVTSDMAASFRRYGVNWQADKITFYFDGKVVGQVATPADLHEPMYMIVNLAVGGSWPGAPNASTVFPATLQVDYIRVYSDAGATGAVVGGSPGEPAGTSGTSGADALSGLAAADVIYGLAGADTINGLGGEDYLRGGDGDDVINGGDAFDDINGNTGADILHGNAGSDWVVGGQDNDQLFGDSGGDIVLGNLGADTANGGTGDDTVRGGQGDDVIVGGDGDDWLSGDKGTDSLTGGLGADVFHASSDAGTERVLDFSRAQGDRIMLDAGTGYSFYQSGADTVIDLDGGVSQIVLVGITASSLQGEWIYLG